MTRMMRGVGFGLVLTGLSLAAGCGGKQSATNAPTTAKPATSAAAKSNEVHERIAPHTCAAKTKLAQILGHNTPPPPPPSDPGAAAEAAAAPPPPPTSIAAGTTKIAANQAYRVVAPSTVLIRTDHGMGTGVVIDPKGYVLTNYHVIADGRKQDFIVSVNVTLGELTPTGRMQRQEKTYEAVVVKGDMVRDMAIIKIKDPPPKLEAAKLAKSAPQIAEKVISVGHAGIGFLWAAKTCSIASVGERQQDASMLAAFDCASVDPAASKAEADMRKTRCDEQKKRLNDALASTTQGLAIQTDCSITHGDSGGPLVNAAGEVVGLNQSIAADLATVSFHVHLDEIRDFTSKYPEEGVAILPDPFCDGGFNPTLEDIDLDGTPDTLVTKGSQNILGSYDRMSLLIDLDEDHFKKNKDGSAETYDAEVALLTQRDATYIWYDTDNDSKFDTLLIDKNNDGTPEQIYRIDADGKPKEEKDKSFLPKHDFSAKFVKDPALHMRLGKIAAAIGGSKYVSAKTLAAAAKTTTIPDPILGGGSQGRVIDTDSNGKSDLAVMRGTFSRGVLIDADEDSLGSIKSGEAADEIVKAKKVDAEVSIIVQGNAVWALYDTDNDSKFDLALMTTNGTDSSSLLATNAWKVSPGGEMTPLPDQLGRKILRPGLIAFPRTAGAMKILGSDIASDEAMGSLPDPFKTKGRFRIHEMTGMKDVPAGSVVEAQAGTSSVMLFDLDHDTKLGAAASADPKKKPAAKPDPKALASVSDADLNKAISDEKFDAEVAIVHRGGADTGGSDWIYYDTDADGKFDLVLYLGTSGQEPTQAYRLKNGKLEADASAVAGKAFRTKSVFKDKAMTTKWKAIATKLFRASSIED